nr:hypothetical protein [Chitinophagales bacterium]
GTTDVLATSHAAAFADAMFYAAGDLVSFTVPFDETDFTGGSGAGNFRVSGDVTGMIVFRNQLIIFTEEKIFVLTGTSSSDFQLDSVSTNIGCVEPDSIQEVNGDIAFLAADGMRMLGATANNNDWSNQTISKNIQQEFNQFRTDFTDFSSTTVRDKSQYRIFGWHTSKLAPASVSYIAAQTLPDQKAFEWSQCDGIKVYSIDSKVYNGDEYIVFCSDTEYVYRLEDGSDYDGTDITSSLWTPYMSFNDPFFRKTLYKMYLYTTPEDSFTGTLNVKYDISDKMRPQPTTIAMDASGGGAKYGTAVYGSSVYFTPSTSIIKAPLVGSGQNASFQFEFNGSEPFTIDTLLIEYATEDRR